MNENKGKGSENKTMDAKDKKRSINWIGDSILKNVKPYLLKDKLKKHEKVYVQSYRGAKTSAMKHHANASKEFENDIYVCSFGTNDLILDDTTDVIGKRIIDVSLQLKEDVNQVFVSSILPRKDNLNEKGTKVNDYLRSRCQDYGLRFIDNSGVITDKHLNQGGLHLSKVGTKLTIDV